VSYVLLANENEKRNQPAAGVGAIYLGSLARACVRHTDLMNNEEKTERFVYGFIGLFKRSRVLYGSRNNRIITLGRLLHISRGTESAARVLGLPLIAGARFPHDRKSKHRRRPVDISVYDPPRVSSSDATMGVVPTNYTQWAVVVMRWSTEIIGALRSANGTVTYSRKAIIYPRIV